jgi:hypothetical protein
MIDWVRDAWPWVTGWLAFVLAAAKGIQAMYAAERDRRALASSAAEREKLALEIGQLKASLGSADLQREKLALEVHLLKNSPEVIGDRRAIYDRLRVLLGEILETAAPTREQVQRMYHIQHDSEFAFPRELAQRLAKLNKSVFELHWTNRVIGNEPIGMSEPQRQIVIAENHAALNEVVAFQNDMVETFREHLNRAGG